MSQIVFDLALSLRGGAEGSYYITLDNDGYINTLNLTETEAPEFAKKALAYASTKTISAISTATDTTDNGDGTQTITYNNVEMGYYLVDSSVGALCSLNTTNLTATIKEKNSVPTVDKKVRRKGVGDYENNKTADMGQVLEFKTTITVGDGPQNYVLHDVMDSGLTYDPSTLKISYQLVVDGPFYNLNNTNYSTPTVTDGHTFDVEFKQTFLDNLKKDCKISIKYEATLNENAKTQDGNVNETWLNYGDNNTSNKATATIKTFRIPVLKFYKINPRDPETPLAGAKFKLSTSSTADLNNNADFIKFVSDPTDTSYPNVYRKAVDTDTDTTTELTSNDAGYATFKGLADGRYFLYETKAPKGYNKLKNPVLILINDTGLLSYQISGGTMQFVPARDPVRIENKTGTVLPSTGGVGTTMMYIVGAVLLIGSGVLLITKKNVK